MFGAIRSAGTMGEPVGSPPTPFAWWLAACVALYIGHAFLALPLAGLQYDELLHLQPIIPPVRIFGTMRFGDFVVPSMLLPYLGCLKTWLIWPLLQVTEPSTAAVRVPSIILGASALGVTLLVLQRIAGTNVARLVGLLAAFDTTFVFCTTYDWGPASLQLLLLGVAAMALVRFHETRSTIWTAVFGFCVGLAIWNKALAIWLIAAFGMVLLLFAPRLLAHGLRLRPLAAAILCFLLGAFPFLAWNKKTHFSHVGGNRGFALEGLVEKPARAWTSLDGSLFLGYLMREEPPQERGPASAEASWLEVLRAEGWRMGNGIPIALMLALPMGFLLLRGARRRIWLAAVLALSLVLFQMMITIGAGTGMHHYILLFPLPFVVIAMPLVALAEGRGLRRRIAAAASTAILGWSAFALYTCFDALRSWGPTPIWSTAITELAPALRRMGAERVFALDWGIDSQLRYYLWPHGLADLGWEFLDTATMPENVRELHLARLRSPDVYYVVFEARHQVRPSYVEEFRAFATREGFAEETVGLVPDAWGVPIYRILRYRPQVDAAAP